jgi:hypothetical protein
MKKIISLIFMLAVSEVNASPVTFKCTTIEGDPAADLVIDASKKIMVWGSGLKYVIHSIDDRYISAYLENKNNDVGG